MLIGDIVPTAEQAAQWADQVEGCEGRIKKPKKGKKEKKAKKQKREIKDNSYSLWDEDSKTIYFTTSTSNPVSSTIAQISSGSLIGGTLLDATNFIESYSCLNFQWFTPGSNPPNGISNYLLVQNGGG